jgi:peptidylprolyl isomerase
VRRTPHVLIAVAAAGTLLLAGCGSSSSAGTPDGSPSASGSPTAPVTVADWTGDSVPKVSGKYGDKPTLTFASGAVAPEQLVRTVLSEGTGPVVKSGDLLAVDYLGQVYDGKVFDNSYDRGQAAAFGIGTQQVIEGWDATLVGMKAGSRVLISVPPAQGYGDAGQPDAGIKGTDTIVFVVDVIASFPGDSAGDPKATPAPAPSDFTVTGDLGTVPTVEVSAGAPKPKKAKATVLATSSGAPLADGLAVIQYVAVDWATKPVDSTWEKSPAPALIKAGGTNAFDSLAGVPVGSRVLVVLPKGDQGGPYALVVDIVAHVPTAAQAAKG